jgi:integrase
MAVKKVGDKWIADFRDSQGNRFRPEFTTKKEADAVYEEARSRIRTGQFIAPKKVATFGKVAADWLATRTDRRPAVVDNYRRSVEVHFASFNDLKIDHIDAHMIERLRSQLRATPFADATVRGIMGTLSQVFKYAVRHKYLTANPMASVERFYAATREHVGGPEGEARSEGTQAVDPNDVLNVSEIRRLIASTTPGVSRVLVAVAAATGARSGELLALRWGAVEFDDGNGGGRIFIRESLSRAKGNEDKIRYRILDPKTASGKRTIPIPHEIVMMLKAWRLQCPKGELDLVFPSSTGTPLWRGVVWRNFAAALRQAGLRSVRFHSLRHSFASALIQHGSPITEVQHLLGHADPSITLRVYSHWLRDASSGAAGRVASALFGRQGQLEDSSSAAEPKSA